MGSATNGIEKSLTFDFAAITEEEVLSLVPPSHASKYSNIKLEVINHLLKIPAPFKFPAQPMKPELPEKERRGLCHAVNNGLADRRMNWAVTYSGIGKCFVVRAYKRWKSKKNRVEDPVEETGVRKPFKIERGYQIGPEMRPVVAAAEIVWNMKWPDILDDRKKRWAVAAVAVKHQDIAQKHVASAIGTTNWSIHEFVSKSGNAKAEIEQLRKGLK